MAQLLQLLKRPDRQSLSHRQTVDLISLPYRSSVTTDSLGPTQGTRGASRYTQVHTGTTGTDNGYRKDSDSDNGSVRQETTEQEKLYSVSYPKVPRFHRRSMGECQKRPCFELHSTGRSTVFKQGNEKRREENKEARRGEKVTEAE